MSAQDPTGSIRVRTGDGERLYTKDQLAGVETTLERSSTTLPTAIASVVGRRDQRLAQERRNMAPEERKRQNANDKIRWAGYPDSLKEDPDREPKREGIAMSEPPAISESPEESQMPELAEPQGAPNNPQTAYGPYDTKLTPLEEAEFQKWKAVYAPNDSGSDYDLRGAFKAGLKPNENHHWPDTFKKPNHPTFSVESKYAVGADRAKAGHWMGETFVPPGQEYTQRAKAIGDRVMNIRPPKRPEAPKAQSANNASNDGVDLKPSAPVFDSPDVDLKRSSPIFDSQPIDASIAAASGSSNLTAAAIPPASRTTSAARSDQPDASQPPPTEDSTPPRKRRLPNFLRFLGANRP